MVQKHLNKIVLISFLFLIFATYVFLGIVLKESIFFSYDMPRVGLKVQEYLANGTFMTSQYYFSEASWQNVAWGPAMIFFYAIFLKISADPLIVSYLLTIVNVFGILSIVILGWKYFSPVVGVVAGALLALNPYWFTYIRVIYQPSPLTLFIPIAMLLHFEATKFKKLSLVLLPIIWIIMFEIYIPTFSFILTSCVFLLISLKKQSYKYLFIGGLLSLVLIVPCIKFYKENPIYIGRFFNAPSKFTPHETTLLERSKNVFLSFVQIPVGGMFRWQTGASYDDFITSYVKYYPATSKVLSTILIISLIWNIYFAIRYKDLKRGVLVGWVLCALWYLIVLWTSELQPRYFLISFPPIMLLTSLFFYDFKNKLVLLIPIFIAMYWCMFNIQYNNFIKNYDFPHGWFYDITETPYVYIKDAMDFVISDAEKNSCNLVLSDDVGNLNFSLWMETEYPWKYIYKRSTQIDDNANNCHYLITHNDLPVNLGVSYKQFGPFAAFRVD